MTHLSDLITHRRAKVAVIGLGYVGVPLASELASTGYQVTGFDIDGNRVASLNAGMCYIPDVDAVALRSHVLEGRFRATARFAELEDADVIIICVPTPLSKTRDPDISSIVEASRRVAATLRSGQLVILESTTYPGTTEDLLLPMLAETGLRLGQDFFVAFSSERVDPGNPNFKIRNTPKVVGGVTRECLRLASALYSAIADTVVPVSSPAVAELSKLLENTFRAVNIGLANEVAQMANVLGVDAWEVIDAAATKPFGFMPFYPGPGLGGHCIPVDPHYLAWKLRSLNYRARFIELASEVNGEMPKLVLDLNVTALNEHEKCLNRSSVLVLGAAYKPNVGDLRESPALDLMTLLKERHAKVSYVDPHIPSLRLGSDTISGLALTEETLQEADCVVIVTAHSGVDYAWVVDNASLIVDTRNVTHGLPSADHIWRLGRPTPASIAAPLQERVG